jgi:hypothetical protein
MVSTIVEIDFALVSFYFQNLFFSFIISDGVFKFPDLSLKQRVDKGKEMGNYSGQSRNASNYRPPVPEAVLVPPT